MQYIPYDGECRIYIINSRGSTQIKDETLNPTPLSHALGRDVECIVATGVAFAAIRGDSFRTRLWKKPQTLNPKPYKKTLKRWGFRVEGPRVSENPST